MKAVFAALAAVLASGPAFASYQTCMTYCMKQHADFDRCHKICMETKAPTDGASAGPGAAKNGASTGPDTAEKCQIRDVIIRQYENFGPGFKAGNVDTDYRSSFETANEGVIEYILNQNGNIVSMTAKVDKEECKFEVVEVVDLDDCSIYENRFKAIVGSRKSFEHVWGLSSETLSESLDESIMKVVYNSDNCVANFKVDKHCGVEVLEWVDKGSDC